ncbi:hypothetical protein DO97_05385 [Neosynechococcus sphagnicola sy1]|uniref:Uncharacterized protein n=1 Tax=Neosynechococcus sphagnicola sy1 TaxID=1497020 RepID=A0A098TKF6_9CYAN|nr:hypothetical protein [Neosynechococcus sphagnicola]KGF72761.1 hypothetical protein DO97_05385 [Neosynechococcus sphagnicola sy1]
MSNCDVDNLTPDHPAGEVVTLLPSVPATAASSVETTPTPLSLPSTLESEGAMVLPSTGSDSSPVGLIQELCECNRNLLRHIAQLEAALATYQMAPPPGENASETVLTFQDLISLQAQVQSLSQELVVAHRTDQQQQDLMATLTVELINSQERIAELERDCALHQQQYQEQSQQLHQTENTCRDLRTRLFRQQSHTLQLKVALERSLERNASAEPLTALDIPGTEGRQLTHGNGMPGNPQRQEWDAAPTLPNHPVAVAKQPLAPKAAPIPPWSISLGTTLQQAPTLDLNQPFQSEGGTETPTEAEVAKITEASDPLWQDLARLIDAATTDSNSAAASGTQTPTVTTNQASIDLDPALVPGMGNSTHQHRKRLALPTFSASVVTAPVSPEVILGASPVILEVAAMAAPNPSENELGEIILPVSQKSLTEAAVTAWSSLVVTKPHPSRRKSEATAVDLPLFLRPQG